MVQVQQLMGLQIAKRLYFNSVKMTKLETSKEFADLKTTVPLNVITELEQLLRISVSANVII